MLLISINKEKKSPTKPAIKRTANSINKKQEFFSPKLQIMQPLDKVTSMFTMFTDLKGIKNV